MKISSRLLDRFAVTRFTRPLTIATMLVVLVVGAVGCPVVQNCFVQENLVSNDGVNADNTDADLVNGWGLAFSPTSFAWVANNGSSNSTVYDNAGNPQSLVVTIPAASSFGPSAPTGIVANTTDSFEVSADTYTSAPALFLFASEDGGISGWNPTISATTAVLAVPRATDAPVYKGLALGSDDFGDYLFATDFANGQVDVFDGEFNPVTTTGGFVDTLIPSDYAPFGIAFLNDLVYVSYAQKGATRGSVVDGEGKGYITTFSTDGVLMRRLVQNTGLNAPWAMVIAPDEFGRFSGKLLVGNHGNGTISAYKIPTGAYRGQLRSETNGLLTIDGLYGLAFGNDANSQPATTLYFSAGPNNGANGLYGSLVVCP